MKNLIVAQYNNYPFKTPTDIIQIVNPKGQAVKMNSPKNISKTSVIM